MQQKIEPLRQHPLAFAHRGARAHAPENTLEAFRLALRLGANALETDVWVTEDGHLVIDHDGVVRQGFRNRPLSSVSSDRLPPSMPLLPEVLASVPRAIDISIDMKDARAFEVIIELASRSDIAPQRLWLCHPDLELLASLRSTHREFRLVHSTRMRDLATGAERHASTVAELGIDAINMHHTDWNGGLVALFHRFSVECFAWDVQYDERLRTLLRMGIDGLYSDHVDRMVDAFRVETGSHPTVTR